MSNSLPPLAFSATASGSPADISIVHHWPEPVVMVRVQTCLQEYIWNQSTSKTWLAGCVIQGQDVGGTPPVVGLKAATVPCQQPPEVPQKVDQSGVGCLSTLVSCSRVCTCKAASRSTKVRLA